MDSTNNNQGEDVFKHDKLKKRSRSEDEGTLQLEAEQSQKKKMRNDMAIEEIKLQNEDKKDKYFVIRNDVDEGFIAISYEVCYSEFFNVRNVKSRSLFDVVCHLEEKVSNVMNVCSSVNLEMNMLREDGADVIFKKAVARELKEVYYNLIPINYAQHWQLAIVCGLAKKDDFVCHIPCKMYHFNPIPNHEGRGIEERLKEAIKKAIAETFGKYPQYLQWQSIDTAHCQSYGKSIPTMAWVLGATLYLISYLGSKRSTSVARSEPVDRVLHDWICSKDKGELYQKALSKIKRLALPYKQWNESSSADKYWISKEEYDNALNKFRIMDDIGLSKRNPSDVFDPLSNDENKLVEFVLSREKSQDSELVEHPRFDSQITRKVLSCLHESDWLTDDVISAYLNMLQVRQENEPGKFLKCHFFNSFFYEKLCARNDFSSMMKWTRKIKYKLLDCDKIFVPINWNRDHWVVVIVDVKEKKLQYLDSFLNEDHEAMKKITWYLKEEAKCKGLKMDSDIESWTKEFPKNIPRQTTTCDCGVFMLKFIDFHTRGLPLNFKQEHIPLFRKKIIIEILNIPGSSYKIQS